MKTIRRITPQEAILCWLRAELSSDRFSDDLTKSLENHDSSRILLTNANLNDGEENELRYKILKSYRGWLEDDLYEYDWVLVELNKDEVGDLQYINYSYWSELSDNTHRVSVAARNVKNGKIVFDVSNDRFWEIANALESHKPLEPIIVLQDSTNLPSRIVEGHARATSYLLSDKIQENLQAALGIKRVINQKSAPPRT